MIELPGHHICLLHSWTLITTCNFETLKRQTYTDLSCSPGHDVEVADGVDHEQHGHGGESQQIQHAVEEAVELHGVHHGRHDKYAHHEYHEDGGGRADAVLLHFQDEAHDDHHHHQGVADGQDGGQPQLRANRY